MAEFLATGASNGHKTKGSEQARIATGEETHLGTELMLPRQEDTGDGSEPCEYDLLVDFYIFLP